jgi:hypothetical protein
MVSLSTPSGRRLTIGGGLAAGPLAWAVNTELGQMLPAFACETGFKLPALISLVLAAAAVAMAGLSWWAADSAGAEGGAGARPWRFIGRLGALMAILFAYALALQGLSSLVLTGCER